MNYEKYNCLYELEERRKKKEHLYSVKKKYIYIYINKYTLFLTRRVGDSTMLISTHPLYRIFTYIQIKNNYI